MIKEIKSIYRIKKEDLGDKSISIVMYSNGSVESNVNGSLETYQVTVECGWKHLTPKSTDFKKTKI